MTASNVTSICWKHTQIQHYCDRKWTHRLLVASTKRDWQICSTLPFPFTDSKHLFCTCEYLNGLHYYSLQPVITIRALNLLPILHSTVSLYHLIEIIIWKGDFLAWCLRGVFIINWSGCLRCLLSAWAINATATPSNFTGVAEHCICTDVTPSPLHLILRGITVSREERLLLWQLWVSFVIHTCSVLNSFEGRC